MRNNKEIVEPFELIDKNSKISLMTEICDFFKYTIFDNIKSFYYNLKHFFINLKTFRKVLWSFRPYDHSYCVDVYVTCLEQLKKQIENGFQHAFIAKKKVTKIQELIDLLNQYETYTEEIDNEYFASVGKSELEINKENGLYFFRDRSKEPGVKEALKVYRKKLKTAEFEYKEKIGKLLFGQSEREIIRLTRQLRKDLKENKVELVKVTDNQEYNIRCNVLDGSDCLTWFD